MRQLLAIVFVAASAMTISGCATPILKSFVGGDVTNIVARYGPPVNAYDVPGERRRAFQWTMNNSYTSPTTVHTTGSASQIGSTSWLSTTSTVQGGRTSNWTCIYTVYAEPNASGSWTVVSFEPPPLQCE